MRRGAHLDNACFGQRLGSLRTERQVPQGEANLVEHLAGGGKVGLPQQRRQRLHDPRAQEQRSSAALR